jgi:uncharacterized protein
MPIFWECDRCTACCRWPGDVNLTDAEIQAIALHLGLSEPEFIRRHARVNQRRTGLSLTEKPDGSCIFLDGNACVIQSVKPGQCRDFPNLWNFPDFRRFCQATPVEMTTAEWRTAVLRATGRNVATPGAAAL